MCGVIKTVRGAAYLVSTYAGGCVSRRGRLELVPYSPCQDMFNGGGRVRAAGAGRDEKTDRGKTASMQVPFD